MHQVLLWDHSLYCYLWLFLIYAFIGWCAEVAAHAVTKGKFINRGFLNGPYCPIYGFGMVILIICLTPIEQNWLLLFLGAVILTTLLELVTAVILEKALHTRWWDYSNQKFNLNGYICLKYSLVWGVAAVFVLKVLDPVIIYFIGWIPQYAGEVLIILFTLCMLADFITVMISLSRINNRMRRAAVIRDKIHHGSDRIGGKIADEVLDIQEKLDQLPDKKSAVQRRLEKAYPNIAVYYKKFSKEELKKLLKEKIADIPKKNK